MTLQYGDPHCDSHRAAGPVGHEDPPQAHEEGGHDLLPIGAERYGTN